MFEASQRYVPLSVLFRLLMNRLGPDRTACWGISSSTLTQFTITGLQRKGKIDKPCYYFLLRYLHQTYHPHIKWITCRAIQLKRTYWRYFKFTELQPWSLQKSVWNIIFLFLKTWSGVESFSMDTSRSLIIPNSSSTYEQINQCALLLYPAVWFHTNWSRTELSHC